MHNRRELLAASLLGALSLALPRRAWAEDQEQAEPVEVKHRWALDELDDGAHYLRLFVTPKGELTLTSHEVRLNLRAGPRMDYLRVRSGQEHLLRSWYFEPGQAVRAREGLRWPGGELELNYPE